MVNSKTGNRPITCEKLIEAAGEIFAQKGLHGSTIRNITQKAGTNIASVNYHFSDKFELYTIVLRKAYQPLINVINQPLTSDSPQGRIRELLSAMLTAALDCTRPKWQTQLIARELVDPTPALDLINGLMHPFTERLHDAVREIRPDLSAQRQELAVASIAAQCIFHVHHAHILRRMFPSSSTPQPEAIVAHVVDLTLAAISGLHTDPCQSAHLQEARLDEQKPTHKT